MQATMNEAVDKGLRILAKMIAEAYLEELAQGQDCSLGKEKEESHANKGIIRDSKAASPGKDKAGHQEVSPLTKNPYPRPVDHFVCTEEVRKVFGEKPKELRIMFPTEEVKQWCKKWLKCYSAATGLICRGHGETAIARVDMATGEIATREAKETELKEIHCKPDRCPKYQRAQCRRIMSLQFLLPDCPGLGVYQIDTSSFFSTVNINSGIELVRSLCVRIAMIPLSLKLAEQEVQPEGNKKKVHILNLTLPHTLAEIQKYARIPPSQVLLPAPDTEAPDDLFPQEILDHGAENPPHEEQALEDIPFIDEKLLQTWETARDKVKALTLQETQVAKWFQKQGMDACLREFETALPPDKFNQEILSRFVASLELYEERLNSRSKAQLR